MSKERVWDRTEYMSLHDMFDNATPEEAITNVQKYLQPFAVRAAKKDVEVKLWVQGCGYDGGYEVEVRSYRWETDKEYKTRIAKEEAAAEKKRVAAEKRKARALEKALATEAEERALFEQLKAKFGE